MLEGRGIDKVDGCTDRYRSKRAGGSYETNHLGELPAYWSLYTPLARQPIKTRGCLCKPAYVASEADLFDKWMINQQRVS
jgi:hypothetical protein